MKSDARRSASTAMLDNMIARQMVATVWRRMSFDCRVVTHRTERLLRLLKRRYPLPINGCPGFLWSTVTIVPPTFYCPYHLFQLSTESWVSQSHRRLLILGCRIQAKSYTMSTWSTCSLLSFLRHGASHLSSSYVCQSYLGFDNSDAQVSDAQVSDAQVSDAQVSDAQVSSNAYCILHCLNGLRSCPQSWPSRL
jgi:hypothetical protein